MGEYGYVKQGMLALGISVVLAEHYVGWPECEASSVAAHMVVSGANSRRLGARVRSAPPVRFRVPLLRLNPIASQDDCNIILPSRL
jgi:hypothetical protein